MNKISLKTYLNKPILCDVELTYQQWVKLFYSMHIYDKQEFFSQLNNYSVVEINYNTSLLCLVNYQNKNNVISLKKCYKISNLNFI